MLTAAELSSSKRTRYGMGHFSECAMLDVNEGQSRPGRLSFGLRVQLYVDSQGSLGHVELRSLPVP